MTAIGPHPHIVRVGVVAQVMVAENIRAARQRLQISQAVMAQSLGLTQSAYSRLETGAVSVTVSQLARIASLLDTRLAALVEDVQ